VKRELRLRIEKAGLTIIDGNGEGSGIRFKKTPADDKRPRRG
jgi:hypothetical protein